MNNKKKTAIYFMYIVDMVSLIVSFIIAYLIKFTWIEKEVSSYRSNYITLFLLIVTLYIIISSIFINDIEFINRSITREVISSFKIIAYVSVFVLVCLFFLKNSADYSRMMLFIFICIAFPTVFLGRVLLKHILHIAYKNDKYHEKLVIVSDSDHIKEVLGGVHNKNTNTVKIVGIVLMDCNKIGEDYMGVKVIADCDTYVDIIQEKEVDSVLLSLREEQCERYTEIITSLRELGKNVHIRLPEYELCDGYKQFMELGEFAVVSYMSVKNMLFYQVILRRFVEVVIGFFGCCLVIITLPFAGLGMLLESPGKAIISNVRVGKNGRKYFQYRYRIVKMNAKECVQSGKNPLMMTGKILYKLHLDKLPGAYNLLCGDIGLIGPKSPSVVEYINYAPMQKRKLSIKPGVIGEWSYRIKDSELAVTSESYDVVYEKNIVGDVKRFVMAMGRLVVYRPKRRLEQWQLDEQINVIQEILDNRKSYEYDRSVYEVKSSFAKNIYCIVKRLADIVLSGIALVVLLPVFLVLMILVIAEDGGNPFYGHIRIGKNGKKIRVYKFRSMKNIDVDIEKILTPEQLLQYRTEFKIDNDPRITKVGGFLRKSSLDELPQLINILKGDISIVGPRPIVEKEIKIYGKDTAKLLSVKPGLTGYWQAYARNNATYESGKRQEMEMYYVEHQSIWLDIKIIFKTVVSVIKGSGAQ